MHFFINKSTISKIYNVSTDLDNLNQASQIQGEKAESRGKEEGEVEDRKGKRSGGQKEEKRKQVREEAEEEQRRKERRERKSKALDRDQLLAARLT